jgi:endogenous inhibitor of DNA gyrase (YacG/DUF329 family)
MVRVMCPACTKLAYWSEGTTEAKCPNCSKFVRAVLEDGKLKGTAIVPARRKTA